MPTSDSEDFESADEGQSHITKRERKARLSSSNYSDSTGPDLEPRKSSATAVNKALGTEVWSKKDEPSEGWDDFDIDENEVIETKTDSTNKLSSTYSSINKTDCKNEMRKSEDTGWDDFGDWGQENVITNTQKDITHLSETDPSIKEVTDRLAASSTNSGGWGWGWNVDSILSSATAGISTITSHVSQGLTTVLETGIGAPDPEELAQRNVKGQEERKPTDDQPSQASDPEQNPPNDGAFPFGNLISGVTKFVETTGTKVLSGGLDTLETIGKKTMQVLQEGDPGLAKKRALLGLDADKPVLSQVLREAKTRAEEEDRVKEQKREAKEVHYENLFDDFEGLVHLEALEMLSKQVSMRIEDKLRSVDPNKRLEIKETLQQVAELCEISEDDEEEDLPSEDMTKPDALHERLQNATRDIGLKMQFQPLIKQYTSLLAQLSPESVSPRLLYKLGVSSLAQTTALSVEIYHKTAEMLLVNARRSTADEADALTQMTMVLTKHISELATLYTEKLNSIDNSDKDQINNYITNIFLEAGNSSTYIQNAFQLTLPILQIGAV